MPSSAYALSVHRSRLFWHQVPLHEWKQTTPSGQGVMEAKHFLLDPNGYPSLKFFRHTFFHPRLSSGILFISAVSTHPYPRPHSFSHHAPPLRLPACTFFRASPRSSHLFHPLFPLLGCWNAAHSFALFVGSEHPVVHWNLTQGIPAHMSPPDCATPPSSPPQFTE